MSNIGIMDIHDSAYNQGINHAIRVLQLAKESGEDIDWAINFLEGLKEKSDDE